MVAKPGRDTKGSHRPGVGVWPESESQRSRANLPNGKMGRHLAHVAVLKAILIRQMHGSSQRAFWNRVSQASERLHLAVIGCISLRAVLPFLRLLIWVCTRLRLWGKGIRRELALFGGNGTLCSPSAFQMALVPKRDRERLFAAILWGLGVRPQGR